MKTFTFISSALLLIFIAGNLSAQTGIGSSNPVAEQILLGNYNPATYTPGVIINNPDSIIKGIMNRVSPDTMKKYLETLASFHNRNTGSDTISTTQGIGAARRWIYSKFQEFSAANENRLVISYLDFTRTICGKTKHRNVFAVLPGLDTTNKEILLVEGHFDSRCENVCDINCTAEGMEDNGSGTVLVMELARVMSKYAFNHTIVFTTVTGEEQGLYGGTAWANYIQQKAIPFGVCLNNDIVGGIICGQTSSPPSCPGINQMDSSNVRIFSRGTGTSIYKGVARYVKLQFEENIKPALPNPYNIILILAEDRTGRGGDHIPFGDKGYRAVRFTSSYEHGNGSGTSPDRQHSTRDILGTDTDGDLVIDSFYVDFNYLKRNIIINGVNLGLLALAPPAPSAPLIEPIIGGWRITMNGADTLYKNYRVGLRTSDLYFDTVLTYTGSKEMFVPVNLADSSFVYFSVANVENTVESLFSDEQNFGTGIEEKNVRKNSLYVLENSPNPFSDFTYFTIHKPNNNKIAHAELLIRDLLGREIQKILLQLTEEETEISFENTGLDNGVYFYSLVVDGGAVMTKKMVVIK